VDGGQFPEGGQRVVRPRSLTTVVTACDCHGLPLWRLRQCNRRVRWRLLGVYCAVIGLACQHRRVAHSPSAPVPGVGAYAASRDGRCRNRNHCRAAFHCRVPLIRLPRRAPSPRLQDRCSSPVYALRSAVWPRSMNCAGPYIGSPQRAHGSPGRHIASRRLRSARCDGPYPRCAVVPRRAYRCQLRVVRAMSTTASRISQRGMVLRSWRCGYRVQVGLGLRQGRHGGCRY
jgi:hypothetical protein